MFIWIGAALTVLGLIGVIWCIRKAAWLRKAQLDEGAIQSEFRKLIFGHMASLGTAFLGIGIAMVGIILSGEG